MSVKENAKAWTVKEQIIEDPVTGLTFQFEVMPDGEFKLRVFGACLPLGNREFNFDEQSKWVGSGTFTGHCRPIWLQEIDG